MMTPLSVRGVKHENKKPVLREGKNTPSGFGAKLNLMSYSAARKAQNEASVKKPFKVTGVDS